jgi:hypothetical protein
MGHAELERRFALGIKLSAPSSRLLTGLSRGRRRLCVVELSGAEGSAEAMPRFYKRAMEAGDEAALLAACPDHYVLSKLDGGGEQVIEATGGSPIASRILLSDADASMLTTEADPAFPVQWVAVGRAAPGHPAAGAIRHQFRDFADGFRVRLTGEFPLAMPGHLINAHRWHLACEFSNWIEAANT